VGNGTGCQDPVCELNLGNYTRHDPTTIECIADNEKSTRISKVFHIEIFRKLKKNKFYSSEEFFIVLDPPKIITNVRTLTGSKSINVFLECSSVGNPLPSIVWLDDNRQEINTYHSYTIKTTNQSSILSFSVYPSGHSKVLYYCRSNNSIGTVEKLINISGKEILSKSLLFSFCETRSKRSVEV
jgi:hypothetical protein